jgi:hypothetical protein
MLFPWLFTYSTDDWSILLAQSVDPLTPLWIYAGRTVIM